MDGNQNQLRSVKKIEEEETYNKIQSNVDPQNSTLIINKSSSQQFSGNL